MTTHRTNVIFTFTRGQVIRDLMLPLEAGEEVCRHVVLCAAEALRPTLASSLRGEGCPIDPNPSPIEIEANQLWKVSMWIDWDQRQAPALAWFAACQGAFYLRRP